MRALFKKQSRFLMAKSLFCIAVVGVTLFAYIENQNDLIELRIAIPALAKEVHEIHEENSRLRYEIERFESPILLMELMRKPEYSHLKYPYLNEEVFLPKGYEIQSQ